MRIGKERCERKAYPHRVYPDRNRIRLRVNGTIQDTLDYCLAKPNDVRSWSLLKMYLTDSLSNDTMIIHL